MRGPLPVIELSPSDIRFMQDSISRRFRNGNSVNGTIRKIFKGEWSVHCLPQIRVVNLNGCYFSFDNRRLYVYKVLQHHGFLETVQVNVAPISQFQRRKLTTRNAGMSVTVRMGDTLKHSDYESTMTSDRPARKTSSLTNNAIGSYSTNNCSAIAQHKTMITPSKTSKGVKSSVSSLSNSCDPHTSWQVERKHDNEKSTAINTSIVKPTNAPLYRYVHNFHCDSSSRTQVKNRYDAQSDVSSTKAATTSSSLASSSYSTSKRSTAQTKLLIDLQTKQLRESMAKLSTTSSDKFSAPLYPYYRSSVPKKVGDIPHSSKIEANSAKPSLISSTHSSDVTNSSSLHYHLYIEKQKNGLESTKLKTSSATTSFTVSSPHMSKDPTGLSSVETQSCLRKMQKKLEREDIPPKAKARATSARPHYVFSPDAANSNPQPLITTKSTAGKSNIDASSSLSRFHNPYLNTSSRVERKKEDDFQYTKSSTISARSSINYTVNPFGAEGIHPDKPTGSRSQYRSPIQKLCDDMRRL